MDPEAELKLLFAVLPESLRGAAEALPGGELLEIVLDLGRPPEARLAGRTLALGDGAVTHEHLDHVLDRVGAVTEDNRAGIERTLHRVSAIRNRRGRVVGITLRVGRAVFGAIDMLRDFIQSGKNILLLGPPGIGKTTKLREVARVLADDLQKRVMVIDTSNEIGGDGDIPHPAIGHARRMQVSRPDRQHAVMIEAVENHMPEVIIVDEIGTEAEAQAARTIAERGVQLVATAHGNTLENLVLNPTLSDLVGGVHTVTLGDEEARRRGTLKTVNERRAPPTFDVVVEMVTRDEVIVHRDTAIAVDALLAGRVIPGEQRTQKDGEVRITEVPRSVAPLPSAAPGCEGSQGPLRVHAYGFGRDVIERATRALSEEVRLVSRPEAADLLFILRSRSGDPRIRRAVEKGSARVRLVKRASAAELRRALRAAFVASAGTNHEVREAIAEAEHAIDRAMSEGVAVALAPRPPRIRRLQHELAERYRMASESSGTGGQRHLVIHPPGEGERGRREPSDVG